jgi:hypothetical protein
MIRKYAGDPVCKTFNGSRLLIKSKPTWFGSQTLAETPESLGIAIPLW